MGELWRRAVWWGADYAYAVGRQARAWAERAQADDYATGTRTPLVMLPGIYENWRFLHPLIVTLHEAGHPVHVIDALGRNRWPIEVGSAHVAHYLDVHDLSGVVLVAHSKGGLVGKHLMAGGGEGARRVRGMVAIATPFGGSVYGRVMPTRALRALAPRHASIVALAAARHVDARIVSVYPRFDPHIPGGSRLEGARNVELPTGGHFRILSHPRIRVEIDRICAPSDWPAAPKHSRRE